MLDSGAITHDRYRIEQLVGHGAMGAVYAAVDLRLGQTVALKHTLLPGPQGGAALDREAQILARLSHPGLPTVSDTFVADEGQCIVMAFVPGPTLADLLDERGDGFPVATVLDWADQILDALEYLHSRQPPVLHRDIKPQNLKLTPDGQVILLDFGLARGPLFQTQLAGRRSVVGYTLPYAPLEQVRGLDTDPRSDLFALAGTLYHMLLGAPPPDALERAAALLAHRPDPLDPLAARRPALPPRLSDTLVQTLALDPAGRPPSATALRARLKHANYPVPLIRPARPPARLRAGSWWRERPMGRWGVVLIAMLITSCLAQLIWVSFAEQMTAPPGIALATARPFRPAPTGPPGQPDIYPVPPAMLGVSEPSIADQTAAALPSTGWVPLPGNVFPPNATGTALAARGMPLPTSTAIPLHAAYPEPRDNAGLLLRKTISVPAIYWGADLAFSPDGRRLYVNSHEGVLALDPTSGTVWAGLADSKNTVGGLALSPDGQTLAYGRKDGLQLLGAHDGRLGFLLRNAAEARWVAFSADGQQIAFNDTMGNVYVTALKEATPEQTRLLAMAPAEAPREIRDLALAPAGDALAVAQGRVWLWRTSDGTLERSFYRQRFDGMAVPAYALAYAPDGKTLAIGYANGFIELVNLETGTITEVGMKGDAAVYALAYAPDGRTLASGSADGLVRLWQTSTMRVGHTFPGHRGPVLAVAFTADGSGLASADAQAVKLWRVP